MTDLKKSNRNTIVDRLVKWDCRHFESISESLRNPGKSYQVRFHVALLRSGNGRLLASEALR